MYGETSVLAVLGVGRDGVEGMSCWVGVCGGKEIGERWLFGEVLDVGLTPSRHCKGSV